MAKEQKEKETTEEIKKIETEPQTEPVKKKKSKTPILILIIILLMTAIGCGCFFLGKELAQKDNKGTEEKDKEKVDIVEEEDGTGYRLNIYSDGYTWTSDKSSFDQEDYEIAFSIHTETNDTEVLAAKPVEEYTKDSPAYVVYTDGGVSKYYDSQADKSYEINIPTNRTDYEIGLSNDKIYSIYYYNFNDDGINTSEDDNGIYIISTKERMYENKYDHLYQLDHGYIGAYTDNSTIDEDGYSMGDNIVNYLLSSKVEKAIMTQKDSECGWFNIANTKDSYFILFDDECVSGENFDIYTKDLTRIASNIGDGEYEFNDDGVSLVEGKKVVKYNTDGKVVSTTKEYGDIKDIIKGYIFYINNKKFYVTDGKNYTKELCEFKSEYYYHVMISGYYSKENLEDRGEDDKEEGIYLVIGDGTTTMVEEDEEEDGGFEIYFNPDTKETKRYELEYIGGYAKPVLYLYPEEETEVTINFEHEDALTTTYPKFKDEWQVTAKPNGDLYDKNGKYYYGLYWEENLNHKVDFSTGFYVTKDNAIDFLEEKLTIIGLNDKERNEFIMYWLPILEKNGQSLVYFELTEEREAYNKLQISPAPDSLLRVAIHVKKVNKKVNIKEEKLTTFERKGFTAVEWGGVVYK